MSAFVVERELIDALVRFACSREMVWTAELGGRWRYLEHGDADALGAELWTENVRSVAYRYPDDGPNDRPAPSGFCDAEAEVYAFPASGWLRPAPGAAAVLKAADCLEYQSCEHPGWESSSARRLLEDIRAAAWRRVPGYDEARWGAPEGWA